MKGLISLALSGILFAGIMNAEVLAVVDGVNITEDNFNELKSRNPGFDFSKLPQKDKKELVEREITNILVSKEAKRLKLDEDPEFKRVYEQVTKSIKNNLLIEFWGQKQQQELIMQIQSKISEADAKKFYESNKAQFNKPIAEARHILVKTEAEARKIIDELNKTPKGNVENKFKDLATKQSIDPSGKQNGGYLGVFTRDDMVKPFADAAFAMSNGTYSKMPVKTDFGYHVIYLIDKANNASFDKVKPMIMQQLAMQEFDKGMKTKIDALRKKSSVQIKF